MVEQNAFVAVVMSDALYCCIASAYKDAIDFKDVEYLKKNETEFWPRRRRLRGAQSCSFGWTTIRSRRTAKYNYLGKEI